MKHSHTETQSIPRKIVASCDGQPDVDAVKTEIVHPENAPSPTDNAVYHAAQTYLGDTYTFDNGGNYELITDNSLIYHDDNENIAELNETPQLAGSRSPAACVIARINNWNNTTGAIGHDPYQVPLYELLTKPDVNLQDCPDRDFQLLEEVRYNNPQQNPVKGRHYMTVVLPARVGVHVRQLYHPQENIPNTYTPNTDAWHAEQYGQAVKQAINTYLTTGDYPDPVTLLNTDDKIST
jgi:hypothetical protein